MIKLAVFDWNATLLSDVTLTLECTNQEFAVIGVRPFGLDYLRRHFEIPLKNYYVNMGLDPAMVASKATEMHAVFHAHYESGINQTRTRPGARALLEALHRRGVTCIILSNHHVRGISEQLERLALTDHFEAILANDDIHGAMHVGKGARLERYLEGGRFESNECFIIGDTAEEISIGKSLGLKTVAISGGMYSVPRLQSARPDLLVSSLTQFNKVWEEM